MLHVKLFVATFLLSVNNFKINSSISADYTSTHNVDDSTVPETIFAEFCLYKL